MMGVLNFSMTVSFLGVFVFHPFKNELCRSQGIQGHVLRVSGNQMPSPDFPREKPRGFKTTLLIYELTHTSQAIREGDFYRIISTKLIKEVVTGEDGSFKVKLAPGHYSLFVKKDELFYANTFDGQGNIHPIEVKKSKWTRDEFRADYGAVY
jgi:hypothetical protein